MIFIILTTRSKPPVCQSHDILWYNGTMADKFNNRPCVYMLRCRDGSLYTGWTSDFGRRLQAHQSGKGGKYTRSRLPVEPVYLELLPDKSAALRREAAIKKMKPTDKRALLSSSSNVLGEFNSQP